MQKDITIKSSLLVITRDYGAFQFLEQFLHDKEYDLLFAEDFSMAENKIQDNYIDICIIDGKSPGEDDYHFFQKFEELREGGDAAVLYLADAIPEDVYSRAKEFKALCFVSRPYSDDELFVKINLLIRLQMKNKDLIRLEGDMQAIEARYQRFTDNVPGIAYTISSDGEILYWSPKLKEILGLEPMDLIENPQLWHDSIHPDDLEKVKEAYKQTYQGEPYTVEYRIQDIDGHWHWFHDSIFYKLESEGKIHFEAIAVDITDKIRAEELLGERDDLYHSFFQRMGAPMLAVVAENGIIGEANKAAVDMYGFTGEEFLKKTIFDIEDAPKDQILAEIDSVKKLKSKRYLRKHKTASGEVVNVVVYATPLSLNKVMMIFMMVHKMS